MDINPNQAIPVDMKTTGEMANEIIRLKALNASLHHACNVANGYLRGIGHGDSIAYRLTKEALAKAKETK